ncbi:HI1506-related protein [Neorhizobium petrolearium]|uniref:HI1506-related protein n=1 Tax=Neorhizobium petrolearium TaxID=515361 RepID=UPI003F800948
MAPKASKPRSSSKAPTNAAATIEPTAVHSEQTAVAVDLDGAANPPGVSVPGGTNTAPADGNGSETTSANGHDQIGAGAAIAPVTPSITPADGTTTAKVGDGNPAVPEAEVTVIGMDLAEPGSDRTGFAVASPEEFQAAFPLTYAFVASFFDRSFEHPPKIRITSTKAGFRRGGIEHSKGPRDFEIVDLLPQQIEAFLAEPKLTVEIVE